MKKNKILLIGPMPDPVTGVSIANQKVVDGLIDKNYKISDINFSYHILENLGSLSFKKIAFYFSKYIKIYKVFLYNIIYITPGQTFFGVVKYSPFILLSYIFRKQIIIHIHGNFLHQEYENCSPLKKAVLRFILSKSSKGIVLSKSLRGNLTPFLDDEKIYELHNFFDNELLDKNNTSDIKTDKKLNILYLSNLIPTKGIFELLEALLMLKKEGVKFQADIAGAIDPDNEKKINKLFEEIGESLKYHGIVKGEKKKKLYLNSDIFVFPTYYPMEGQPISILEAMATKNTIITTDHSGIPDIFNENENGFYVEKQSSQSIYEKLLYVSENLDELENIKKTNYSYALNSFSEEKFISNFIDIIKK